MKIPAIIGALANQPTMPRAPSFRLFGGERVGDQSSQLALPVMETTP